MIWCCFNKVHVSRLKKDIETEYVKLVALKIMEKFSNQVLLIKKTRAFNIPSITTIIFN